MFLGRGGGGGGGGGAPRPRAGGGGPPRPSVWSRGTRPSWVIWTLQPGSLLSRPGIYGRGSAPPGNIPEHLYEYHCQGRRLGLSFFFSFLFLRDRRRYVQITFFLFFSSICSLCIGSFWDLTFFSGQWGRTGRYGERILGAWGGGLGL